MVGDRHEVGKQHQPQRMCKCSLSGKSSRNRSSRVQVIIILGGARVTVVAVVVVLKESSDGSSGGSFPRTPMFFLDVYFCSHLHTY